MKIFYILSQRLHSLFSLEAIQKEGYSRRGRKVNKKVTKSEIGAGEREGAVRKGIFLT